MEEEHCIVCLEEDHRTECGLKQITEKGGDTVQFLWKKADVRQKFGDALM